MAESSASVTAHISPSPASTTSTSTTFNNIDDNNTNNNNNNNNNNDDDNTGDKGNESSSDKQNCKTNHIKNTNSSGTTKNTTTTTTSSNSSCGSSANHKHVNHNNQGSPTTTTSTTSDRGGPPLNGTTTSTAVTSPTKTASMYPEREAAAAASEEEEIEDDYDDEDVNDNDDDVDDDDEPEREENGHMSSSEEASASLPSKNGLGSDVSSLASTPSTPPQSVTPQGAHPSSRLMESPQPAPPQLVTANTASSMGAEADMLSGGEAADYAASIGVLDEGVVGLGLPHVTPAPGGNGAPAPKGQHVVHVHVNAGETFSVRLGDQIQHIQGPATVRMVSSNGPPVPMPMQVPPGHMVQQIVDEHGILTHVILSPQLPPMGPGQHMTTGPNNAQQYYPAPYSPYPSGPQYASHHHPHPHSHPHPHAPSHAVHPHSHMHTGMPPHHVQSPTPHSCSNHVPVQSLGASPPLNSSDDRAQRQRNRVRKKMQQRRPPQEGYFPPSQQGRNSGRRRGAGGGVNGDVYHGNGGHVNSHVVMDNGPVEPEEDNSLILHYLSSVPPPKVTKIHSRSAVIKLSPPEKEVPELDINIQNLKYELQLSDKGRDVKFKTVFCGDATEITLKDLKPSIEYFLRVSALICNELKGGQSEAVSFRTQCCEPEKPQPPKLLNKSKTYIQLKWNATCDNGSKICTYCLEWDEGKGDNSFAELYNGLGRQYKAVRLNASTRYLFRLAAINGVGKSEFSETASYYTSGSVPSQPDPPMLSEQFVFSLTLSWIKRPTEEEFTLQMDDEATGHGFITVYNGSSLSHCQKQLRRNTEYRFRMASKNEEGLSKWSDAVSFRTLPDRPQAPAKPQIKGKVLSHTFRVTWGPPADDGGTMITKYIVELDDGQGYETVYEGSDREHHFEQLSPGHQYRVRVACCSVGGRSEFSDYCLTTTLPVAPGQCQAPKLQGKPKATSLHLRWSYPDYDGGSKVTQFAAQMISPDNSMREVYTGPDLACIVAGLMPGRPYLFQVHAINRAGAGPWSELLDVVSGAGVPDAPRRAQLTCRSPHSAMVTWDQPLDNGAPITEYHLEWAQGSQDTVEFSQLYVGPNLGYEAKGLTPATSYIFRVQALNAAGPSPYSLAACCQTPPSSPGAVMSVRWQAQATGIQLWWRPPACNGSELLSYNIAIGDKQVMAVEPLPEYTLDNLLPETSYKVRIQAVNGIGVGPYSPVTKVTTRPLPPSPPRLECISGGATSLKLKWGDGRNTDHLHYTLEMEREDGSFQAVYSGLAHTYKVNRLTEVTSYEFRIFASNDAGKGPYSDTVTFTTTMAPPPPPKGVRVHKVEEEGCLVEWTGCRTQGSDPLTYTLQLLAPHSANHTFKQVYRGAHTQHRLQGLQPGREYQVRVCAVRECSHPSPTTDLPGPFSPPTSFTTLSPAVSSSASQRQGASQSKEAESGTQATEGRQWTDQQWAAIILIGFVLLALVVAILLQQLVTYGNPADSSSSSSSSPPHHHQSGQTY